MTDTNKLKELAEAANRARRQWYTEDDCCWWTGNVDEGDFLAAANPQAILGLIERLEKAEQHWANENSNNMALIAEVERLRSQVDHLINQHMPREPIPDMPGWTRVIDADRLKAENEALRKQLEQVHPFKFAGQHDGPDLKCAACGGYHYGLPPNMPCPKSVAIAQDAALEGGAK